MEFFLLTLIFLLGASVGSFINSLVYRLNHNLAPLGRSFCDNCKHPLGVFDLIPVASYFILRGRCRYCGQPISWELPWVELLLGLLFVFSWVQVRGLGEFFLQLVVLSALVAVATSDFLYRTIPDAIVVPATALVFSATPLLFPAYFPDRVAAAVLGWLFFSFVYLLTKRKGMGLGDASLALLIGASLGLVGTSLALFLAFLTGAGVGVILVFAGKKRLKSQIPFGPFLSGSAIGVIFLKEWLIELLFPGLII